jgi:hypothetical protein
MSLYWYNIQNLDMGTYTLRATGTGGFVLGGNAVYFVHIRVIPPHKIITITSPNTRDAMLAQYAEYLDDLAHLEGLTPGPNPQRGTITIPGEQQAKPNLSVLLGKSLGRLDKLNQMVPLPDPPRGVYVVQKNPDQETLHEALAKAMKQIAKLEEQQAMLVIKGNQ